MFGTIWILTKKTIGGWVDHRASSMGASLAYYTVFSMAPLLLIVISIAGIVFGVQATQGEIFGQLRGFMGNTAAIAVQNALSNLNRPETGMISTLIGVAVLFVGASTVFSELKQDLDIIWDSPAQKSSGIWSWLTLRLVSIGVILGLGFLLIASLLVSAALAGFGHYLNGVFPSLKVIVQIFNEVFSFAMMALLFALLLKFIPSAEVPWKSATLGALVTSFLFIVGKIGISLYIGKSGVASLFGAAGGVIVLLLWIYYSAQIFLLGAELTHGLAGLQREGKLDKQKSWKTVRAVHS